MYEWLLYTWSEVIQLNPLLGWTDEQEERGGEEDISQCQLKVKLMELEWAELYGTENWIWSDSGFGVRERERYTWWSMRHSFLTRCDKCDSARQAEFASTRPYSGGGRQTDRQADRWGSGLVHGSPTVHLQRSESCDSHLLSSYSSVCLRVLTHQLSVSRWRDVTETLWSSVSPPPPCPSQPHNGAFSQARLEENF